MCICQTNYAVISSGIGLHQAIDRLLFLFVISILYLKLSKKGIVKFDYSTALNLKYMFQ